MLFAVVQSLSWVQFFCDLVDQNPLPPGSSVHGIFLGKNTGVCCHFLLQGIFLTQGLNPYLLHCEDSSPLSQLGSPRKGLIWVFLTWGLRNSKRLKQLGIRWASFSQSCFRDFSVTFPHGLDWASSQHAGLKEAGLPTGDSEF